MWLSHRVIRPSRNGYRQILGETLFTHKRFFAQIRTMKANLPEDQLFCVAAVNRIPVSDKRSYPPVVLMGPNYSCAFRLPDDDSSSAFHPTESGTGRLQH